MRYFWLGFYWLARAMVLACEVGIYLLLAWAILYAQR
jgi:hypothetical protein